MCGICFVIACSSPLLIFGASGKLCFVTGTFPGDFHLYVFIAAYSWC